MPKINPKISTTYGTSPLDNSQTFRDRLMSRFQSHEYVRVINVDNEPITWQYLPSHSEEYEFTPDPMKITRRGDVEVYMLNPGESEVLLGECAYIMIEKLYKQIIAKKVVSGNPDIGPGQARSFNFSDPVRQEEEINRIFLGVETPQFGSQTEELEEEAKLPKPKNETERKLRTHLKQQVA